jgi:hypothetical protein
MGDMKLGVNDDVKAGRWDHRAQNIIQEWLDVLEVQNILTPPPPFATPSPFNPSLLVPPASSSTTFPPVKKA